MNLDDPPSVGGTPTCRNVKQPAFGLVRRSFVFLTRWGELVSRQGFSVLVGR